mgnify:CR=1 FL=1
MKIFLFSCSLSSCRYFRQKKYLLFVIYHTVSGFLDAFDGIFARWLDQKSVVGLYFEHILDPYAHFVMYTCIGLLYPSYIIYFYFEIALELWNLMFNSFLQSAPTFDRTSLQQTTFLSETCQFTIHDHPNLRLFNWYGPDIFHTLLLIRFILLDENSRKINYYIKRYISLERLHLLILYVLIFTGFFSFVRTFVTSCFMLDKFYRLAAVPTSK